VTDSENLRPFPGASDIPSGGQRYRGISEAFRRFIEQRPCYLRRRKPMTGAEAVALSILRRAMAGDVEAALEVTDRVEGKVPSVFTGADGAPADPAGSIPMNPPLGEQRSRPRDWRLVTKPPSPLSDRTRTGPSKPLSREGLQTARGSSTRALRTEIGVR
jgi:hypothetical protein